MRRVPLSGALFLAGFLAITGSPPFGPFVSEFTIVSAAFDRADSGRGGLFLLLLGVVFIGMGATVLAVVQGEPSRHASATTFRETWARAPHPLLMGLVLLLGLYVPAPLVALLQAAAGSLDLTAEAVRVCSR